MPQLDTSSLVIFLTLIFLSFVLTVLSFIPVYQYYVHPYLMDNLLVDRCRELVEFVFTACAPTISLTACAVLALVAIFVW